MSNKFHCTIHNGKAFIKSPEGHLSFLKNIELEFIPSLVVFLKEQKTNDVFSMEQLEDAIAVKQNNETVGMVEERDFNSLISMLSDFSTLTGLTK